MSDQQDQRVVKVHPVVSYTTAVTSQAMCIIELAIPAGGTDEAGNRAVALRFRLNREDAAALGRALLDSAEFATKLANTPSKSADRH